MTRLGLPNLGLGVGLRAPHLPAIMAGGPRVAWFEVISENLMHHRGPFRYAVDMLSEQVPLVLHGVCLSIGSAEPLDRAYLDELKRLTDEIGPAWVSDHLCWTGLGGHNSHDLLPLPLTEETLEHVTARVHDVQAFLERPLVLENPSTYVTFAESTMPEWEFLGRLARETGCGILLDLNNCYVSGHNHGFDPERYIRALPHEQIVQLHLAGPSERGSFLVDTHDASVPAPVWELYALAQRLTGGVSALLEWDANLPDYDGLLAELAKAESIVPAAGVS